MVKGYKEKPSRQGASNKNVKLPSVRSNHLSPDSGGGAFVPSGIFQAPQRTTNMSYPSPSNQVSHEEFQLEAFHMKNIQGWSNLEETERSMDPGGNEGLILRHGNGEKTFFKHATKI